MKPPVSSELIPSDTGFLIRVYRLLLAPVARREVHTVAVLPPSDEWAAAFLPAPAERGMRAVVARRHPSLRGPVTAEPACPLQPRRDGAAVRCPQTPGWVEGERREAAHCAFSGPSVRRQGGERGA